MKQYKVTITNGDYPLSYTCDTIAEHTIAADILVQIQDAGLRP